MPLRVTIEAVPGGDESRAEVISQFTVTQTDKMDNEPGGWRRYTVSDDLRRSVVFEGHEHRRANGAVVLVSAVLSRLSTRRDYR